MTGQQSGVLLAVVGGFLWAVCSFGLVCYGIAWSRRDPARATASILSGVVLLALGVTLIALAPGWGAR